ncbi:MAG: imelysin family protein [Deltaproteobacteria bacterium]|nr:imelysin family protein [Deltaproteobacteria bacterium]
MPTTSRYATSGSSLSWLLPCAMVCAGALGWACQDPADSADGSAEGAEDGGNMLLRQAVLDSVANNVIVPQTVAFEDATDSLRTAVRTYVEASDTGAVESTLLAAQQAWREAMTQGQRLEVMQLGPAAPSLVAIGGEDRRDAVYSWPTVDTCSVDRALAEQAYAADDFFTTQLVWAHGLDALEYLLFVHDADHTCPTQVQLDSAWDALSFEQVEQQRRAYAQVLADQLASQASALATRWSPQGDDFASALANPGQAGSPYANELEALDEVFRAMFYLDKQTKDGKLGAPLGLVDGCAAAPCTDQMESPWSGHATASIIANLQGLRLMIQGGPDPDQADGFDDLLQEVGQGDVADDLLRRIDTAISVAEGIDVSLQESAVASPERVTALHTAVKDVTDILKGPFVMALMLTIPAEGAGDND